MPLNRTITWVIDTEFAEGLTTAPEDSPVNKPIKEILDNTLHIKNLLDNEYIPRPDFGTATVESLVNFNKIFNIPEGGLIGDHNHDDRYYPKADVDGFLSIRPVKSLINSPSSVGIHWNNLSNKPPLTSSGVRIFGHSDTFTIPSNASVLFVTIVGGGGGGASVAQSGGSSSLGKPGESSSIDVGGTVYSAAGGAGGSYVWPNNSGGAYNQGGQGGYLGEKGQDTAILISGLATSGYGGSGAGFPRNPGKTQILDPSVNQNSSEYDAIVKGNGDGRTMSGGSGGSSATASSASFGGPGRSGDGGIGGEGGDFKDLLITSLGGFGGTAGINLSFGGLHTGDGGRGGFAGGGGGGSLGAQGAGGGGGYGAGGGGGTAPALSGTAYGGSSGDVLKLIILSPPPTIEVTVGRGGDGGSFSDVVAAGGGGGGGGVVIFEW